MPGSQNNKDESAEILASLKGVTSVLNDMVTSLDRAATNVDLDTQARERKVQRLEEQALALQDQTKALHEQTNQLRRYTKVLFAGFVLNVVALFLMSYLLFQFSRDSDARSRAAAEQRNQQQELLVKLSQQTAGIARCAITAKGDLVKYDACVRVVSQN
jgi:predicted PurR-regulated permease PerM